ncbi:MAG: hypothetical protein WKG07_30930 [Hymenobacter sp.]
MASDTLLFRAVGYKPHRLVLSGTTLAAGGAGEAGARLGAAGCRCA